MTGLRRFDGTSASYLASYLADQKGEEKRRQFNQRLPARLIQSLKIVATLKGLRLSEAVEQALLDWIERNRPPSVTVNVYQPISVSVSKIDHVEVQLAVERLTRLAGILERCSNEYRAKWREDLLRELRKAYILEHRTRDPELQQIIAAVETHLR